MNRIDQMFSERGPTASFEFFPPKDGEAWDALFSGISAFEQLQPSFVSVTYGAGGTTRELTRERGRLESLIRANVGFADETAAPGLLQNAAAEQAGEVDGDTLQVAEELAQLQTKAAAARASRQGATGSAVSASVNGRRSELHSVGVLQRDAGR